MPTISVFYGVVIRMFWADHRPPHFHASYGEHEAVVDIRTGSVIRGSIPPTAAALTLRWAQLHREELLENWELCAKMQTPRKIPPLE
jgi:hypothetical protein